MATQVFENIYKIELPIPFPLRGRRSLRNSKAEKNGQSGGEKSDLVEEIGSLSPERTREIIEGIILLFESREI